MSLASGVDFCLNAAALGDAPAQKLSPGYFFYLYCATWSPGHRGYVLQGLELNFQLSWRFTDGCKGTLRSTLVFRSWQYHYFFLNPPLEM